MGLLEGVDTRSVGWWRSSARSAVAREARFFVELSYNNDDGVDILPASFNSAADAWRYKAPFDEADEVL